METRTTAEDRVIADIQAERRRQVQDEGYTIAHDDSSEDHELARMAVAYTLNNDRVFMVGEDRWAYTVFPQDRRFAPKLDRRRNLVIAAALLVAEIERLDRQPVTPR